MPLRAACLLALRYTAERGARTASGEPYDPHRLTLAHRAFPFGALVEVTNPATGRTVRARVNDRDTGGGLVRLSHRAADHLGLPPRGAWVLPVQVGGARIWRVCYGVYPARADAAAAQAALAARGVDGFVRSLVTG